uniref:Uncharacterized protein n=1 Tax=Chlamydomonas chlamydogama TaxID=225041 RepID=A0A7S2QUM4_9CHLO|mmetsp:Transcript_641/g.1470  ORF Transcript_641/g.1470 Transcript_641/m.1470 type:complete len:851 (+) Transcript_641:217-2769(+)
MQHMIESLGCTSKVPARLVPAVKTQAQDESYRPHSDQSAWFEQNAAVLLLSGGWYLDELSQQLTAACGLIVSSITAETSPKVILSKLEGQAQMISATCDRLRLFRKGIDEQDPDMAGITTEVHMRALQCGTDGFEQFFALDAAAQALELTAIDGDEIYDTAFIKGLRDMMSWALEWVHPSGGKLLHMKLLHHWNLRLSGEVYRNLPRLQNSGLDPWLQLSQRKPNTGKLQLALGKRLGLGKRDARLPVSSSALEETTSNEQKIGDMDTGGGDEGEPAADWHARAGVRAAACHSGQDDTIRDEVHAASQQYLVVDSTRAIATKIVPPGIPAASEAEPRREVDEAAQEVSFDVGAVNNSEDMDSSTQAAAATLPVGAHALTRPGSAMIMAASTGGSAGSAGGSVAGATSAAAHQLLGMPGLPDQANSSPPADRPTDPHSRRPGIQSNLSDESAAKVGHTATPVRSDGSVGVRPDVLKELPALHVASRANKIEAAGLKPPAPGQKPLQGAHQPQCKPLAGQAVPSAGKSTTMHSGRHTRSCGGLVLQAVPPDETPSVQKPSQSKLLLQAAEKLVAQDDVSGEVHLFHITPQDGHEGHDARASLDDIAPGSSRKYSRKDHRRFECFMSKTGTMILEHPDTIASAQELVDKINAACHHCWQHVLPQLAAEDGGGTWWFLVRVPVAEHIDVILAGHHDMRVKRVKNMKRLLAVKDVVPGVPATREDDMEKWPGAAQSVSSNLAADAGAPSAAADSISAAQHISPTLQGWKTGLYAAYEASETKRIEAKKSEAKKSEAGRLQTTTCLSMARVWCAANKDASGQPRVQWICMRIPGDGTATHQPATAGWQSVLPAPAT